MVTLENFLLVVNCFQILYIRSLNTMDKLIKKHYKEL